MATVISSIGSALRWATNKGYREEYYKRQLEEIVRAAIGDEDYRLIDTVSQGEIESNAMLLNLLGHQIEAIYRGIFDGDDDGAGNIPHSAIDGFSGIIDYFQSQLVNSLGDEEHAFYRPGYHLREGFSKISGFFPTINNLGKDMILYFNNMPVDRKEEYRQRVLTLEDSYLDDASEGVSLKELIARSVFERYVRPIIIDDRFIVCEENRSSVRYGLEVIFRRLGIDSYQLDEYCPADKGSLMDISRFFTDVYLRSPILSTVEKKLKKIVDEPLNFREYVHVLDHVGDMIKNYKTVTVF